MWRAIWAIRPARAGGTQEGQAELRPYVLDDVLGWLPSRARLLAHTVLGARALLPNGAQFVHADFAGAVVTEWWALE